MNNRLKNSDDGNKIFNLYTTLTGKVIKLIFMYAFTCKQEELHF